MLQIHVYMRRKLLPTYKTFSNRQQHHVIFSGNQHESRNSDNSKSQEKPIQFKANSPKAFPAKREWRIYRPVKNASQVVYYFWQKTAITPTRIIAPISYIYQSINLSLLHQSVRTRSFLIRGPLWRC